MGYSNPIVHYGAEKFCRECAEAGVDGLIVPDLPPEEAEDIGTQAKNAGLSLIFLIAPTSSPERIRKLDALTSGYNYCVSITGVTGSRHDLKSDEGFRQFLTSVKSNTRKPFMVGFSITTRSDVEYVWTLADGAIVGTALIKALEPCRTIEACAKAAQDFVTSLIPAPDLTKEGTSL